MNEPSTTVPGDRPTQVAETGQPQGKPLEVKVYQHSMLFYWWPVWLLGFVMAAITWVGGEQVTVGGETMWFHPSRNVGVIYLTVTLFVLLVTHMTLRGALAMMMVTIAIAAAIIFAVLGWWDDLFSLESHLSIHMDLGFYLVVSTTLLVLWVAAFFIFDRVTCYVFRPGQMTEQSVFGGQSRTYDTRGMAIYRLRADPFRHWSLGFGSGDLHIATTGAERITMDLCNVMMVNDKLKAIQQLSAMSPEKPSDLTTTPEQPSRGPGGTHTDPPTSDH